jgi:hypothetical protein
MEKEKKKEPSIISLLQLCKTAGVNYSRAYKFVSYGLDRALNKDEKLDLKQASLNAHNEFVKSLKL